MINKKENYAPSGFRYLQFYWYSLIFINHFDLNSSRILIYTIYNNFLTILVITYFLAAVFIAHDEVAGQLMRC